MAALCSEPGTQDRLVTDMPIFARTGANFTADSSSASGLIPDSLDYSSCCQRNCLCHVKTNALAHTRQGLSTILPLKYQLGARGA
jgi:hypothetical protein